MHRARASTKMNNNRADGYNYSPICLDLTILDVRWPKRFFSERYFIYTYLHIAQKWTKTQGEKFKKKIKISLHGTWNPDILWLQSALNYGR